MTAKNSTLELNDWQIVERRIPTDRMLIARNETIFTIGNGLLSLRGSRESIGRDFPVPQIDSTASVEFLKTLALAEEDTHHHDAASLEADVFAAAAPRRTVRHGIGLGTNTRKGGRDGPFRATYMNGVYEEISQPQGTQTFGANSCQSECTLIATPDFTIIDVFIDGERVNVFDLVDPNGSASASDTLLSRAANVTSSGGAAPSPATTATATNPPAEATNYSRVLNMRSGELKTSFIFTSKANGHVVRIESSRIVSFTHKGIAAIRLSVTLLSSKAAEVVFVSRTLTPPKHMSHLTAHNAVIDHDTCPNQGIHILETRTNNSRRDVVVACHEAGATSYPTKSRGGNKPAAGGVGGSSKAHQTGGRDSPNRNGTPHRTTSPTRNQHSGNHHHNNINTNNNAQYHNPMMMHNSGQHHRNSPNHGPFGTTPNTGTSAQIPSILGGGTVGGHSGGHGAHSGMGGPAGSHHHHHKGEGGVGGTAMNKASVMEMIPKSFEVPNGVVSLSSAYLGEGSSAVFEKIAAFVSEGHYRRDDLVSTARNDLLVAVGTGFDGLVAEQREHLKTLWSEVDIKIAAPTMRDLLPALRLSHLQLYMNAGQTRGTSIATKGLCPFYGGQYSWDTEIIISPYFTYNLPHISKNFIQFRIDTLPQAMERAVELGLGRGAVYPWRTINGYENWPAVGGTVPLHINADIAFAIRSYYEVTHDAELMMKGAGLVVMATALAFIQWGSWSRGAFHIRNVTGPDEYNILVNDNYYTNIMAQHHLLYAVDLAGSMLMRDPQTWRHICELLRMTNYEEDLRMMREAADKMAFPYDAMQRIHLQDASFLNKRVGYPLGQHTNHPAGSAKGKDGASSADGNINGVGGANGVIGGYTTNNATYSSNSVAGLSNNMLASVSNASLPLGAFSSTLPPAAGLANLGGASPADGTAAGAVGANAPFGGLLPTCLTAAKSTVPTDYNHPVTIYRHRICKISDIILAQVLFTDRFTKDEKLANFDFYEGLTTHDVSASWSTFSIMASHLGLREKAFAYFRKSLMVDLDDIVGNASESQHIVSLAGSWACVVKGFGGMRVSDGHLHFNPWLPDGWTGYSFKVKFAKSTVVVSVSRCNVVYNLLYGTRLMVGHAGSTNVHLIKGKPVTIKLSKDIRSFDFDAVVIDLNSIIHNVEEDHYVAWKEVIDELLQDHRATQTAVLRQRWLEYLREAEIASKDPSHPNHHNVTSSNAMYPSKASGVNLVSNDSMDPFVSPTYTGVSGGAAGGSASSNAAALAGLSGGSAATTPSYAGGTPSVGLQGIANANISQQSFASNTAGGSVSVVDSIANLKYVTALHNGFPFKFVDPQPCFTYEAYLHYIRNHPHLFGKQYTGLRNYLATVGRDVVTPLFQTSALGIRIPSLETSGFDLPYGSPTNAPGLYTLHALANKKFEVFRLKIALRGGAQVVKGARELIDDLRRNGIAVGCVSSSRNGEWLARQVGVGHLFDVFMDGKGVWSVPRENRVDAVAPVFIPFNNEGYTMAGPHTPTSKALAAPQSAHVPLIDLDGVQSAISPLPMEMGLKISSSGGGSAGGGGGGAGGVGVGGATLGGSSGPHSSMGGPGMSMGPTAGSSGHFPNVDPNVDLLADDDSDDGSMGGDEEEDEDGPRKTIHQIEWLPDLKFFEKCAQLMDSPKTKTVIIIDSVRDVAHSAFQEYALSMCTNGDNISQGDMIRKGVLSLPKDLTQLTTDSIDQTLASKRATTGDAASVLRMANAAAMMAAMVPNPTVMSPSALSQSSGQGGYSSGGGMGIASSSNITSASTQSKSVLGGLGAGVATPNFAGMRGTPAHLQPFQLSQAQTAAAQQRPRSPDRRPAVSVGGGSTLPPMSVQDQLQQMHAYQQYATTSAIANTTSMGAAMPHPHILMHQRTNSDSRGAGGLASSGAAATGAANQRSTDALVTDFQHQLHQQQQLLTEQIAETRRKTSQPPNPNLPPIPSRATTASPQPSADLFKNSPLPPGGLMGAGASVINAGGKGAPIAPSDALMSMEFPASIPDFGATQPPSKGGDRFMFSPVTGDGAGGGSQSNVAGIGIGMGAGMMTPFNMPQTPGLPFPSPMMAGGPRMMASPGGGGAMGGAGVAFPHSALDFPSSNVGMPTKGASASTASTAGFKGTGADFGGAANVNGASAALYYGGASGIMAGAAQAPIPFSSGPLGPANFGGAGAALMPPFPSPTTASNANPLNTNANASNSTFGGGGGGGGGMISHHRRSSSFASGNFMMPESMPVVGEGGLGGPNAGRSSGGPAGLGSSGSKLRGAAAPQQPASYWESSEFMGNATPSAANKFSVPPSAQFTGGCIGGGVAAGGMGMGADPPLPFGNALKSKHTTTMSHMSFNAHSMDWPPPSSMQQQQQQQQQGQGPLASANSAAVNVTGLMNGAASVPFGGFGGGTGGYGVVPTGGLGMGQLQQQHGTASGASMVPVGGPPIPFKPSAVATSMQQQQFVDPNALKSKHTTTMSHMSFNAQSMDWPPPSMQQQQQPAPSAPPRNPLGGTVSASVLATRTSTILGGPVPTAGNNGTAQPNPFGQSPQKYSDFEFGSVGGFEI